MAAPSCSSSRLPSAPGLERVSHLFSPHVTSFNHFLGAGLSAAVEDIPAYETRVGEDTGYVCRMWWESVSVGTPTYLSKIARKETRLLPRETRERRLTYAAPVTGRVMCQLMRQAPRAASEDDGDAVEVEAEAQERRPRREDPEWSTPFPVEASLGSLPIMVGSSRCHLTSMNAEERAANGEEAHEMGGYFIIHGLERMIRLIQMTRRNYALAISRPSFKTRGPNYSTEAVIMRCVRPDQTSITLTLHYLMNGTSTLRVSIRKQEYFVPIVLLLKALHPNTSDRDIYMRMIAGQEGNTFLSTRLELLLRDAKAWGTHTHRQCLVLLGRMFRSVLPAAETSNDKELGECFLDRYICVHLSDHAQKQDTLYHMLRKLYAFVEGRCTADNGDAFMNHELLLPGQLVCAYFKEKLEEVLFTVRRNIMLEARLRPKTTLKGLVSRSYYGRMLKRFAASAADKVTTFISTGNVVSSTGLDLMQVSGFTIVAERLNLMRYLSHYQSVHRGQFFTTMKTTTVRKLLPESWGFLCPVHTPDGAPCGLLNHLAVAATVVSTPPVINEALLVQQLIDLGVVPAGSAAVDAVLNLSQSKYLPVMLEGRYIGGVTPEVAVQVVCALRCMKVEAQPRVDPSLEIAYIPFPTSAKTVSTFPGIYLGHGACRMVRPVLQRATGKTELIGPLEQVFMDIACLPDDVRPSTTHMELDPTNMLSHVASLTPFSDYNQSPRNMYQCQMAKQTMGTPVHSYPYRADIKLYRILFPEVPIVQTRRHAEYQTDDFAQGTNAVVAVISYTGYDMEDAMILNKSSFERGFGHGCVYKTHVYDLLADAKMQAQEDPELYFTNTMPDGSYYVQGLDGDGLPSQGQRLESGQPLYAYYDAVAGEYHVSTYRDSEIAYVDTVRVLGREHNRGEGITSVRITLRLPRNPVIGDKFSSRHGQKGVLSILWPTEDMPFTESGMNPDVIINPHAFPSRMTIGMLIESMAGKSGALHGVFQDATPFSFHEDNTAIDHFGQQLRAAGYAYHGSEPLYSGITGTLMHADIYIGLVYYQRLRHMVSDKSQVRATGPVNPVTRQPVGGRKRRGGVRLGEMERDSLLSHGVSFCLHDRLMNCSDRHLAHICRHCGSLLAVRPERPRFGGGGGAHGQRRSAPQVGEMFRCVACKSHDVEPIALPYVYRYLANELAAMGVKLSMRVPSHPFALQQQQQEQEQEQQPHRGRGRQEQQQQQRRRPNRGAGSSSNSSSSSRGSGR